MKVFVLFFLLCVGSVSAQEINCEVVSPLVRMYRDSSIVSFQMSVKVGGLDGRWHVRCTPVLACVGHEVELPYVLMNGKRAHLMYKRHLLMLKRKGQFGDTNVYCVTSVENQHVNYNKRIVLKGWESPFFLSVRVDFFNAENKKVKTIVLPAREMKVEGPELPRSSSSLLSRDSLDVVHPNVKTGEKCFKGHYIQPERDGVDERNQKELNFSLEEARVIAKVKPHLLSLRELYSVALSYKGDLEQFYEIIETSVKVYPASPVANLNAASAAIERGDARMAGVYLQMASYDTVAYKNCRGVYELLCNNTYEGIRLLKSAKAEGCGEADYNLKLFFELNQ